MMSAEVVPPSITDLIQRPNPNNSTNNPNPLIKRKRSLPGAPDPDAEVIALSPESLMATNRFMCEVCKKGFKRDQNLQLHRRGHNLPWKLKQRSSKEVRKKVYICPEKTCVHHDPCRALGDLTGIKKHYSRKHGEKKWKCEKCSKKYAVQSDLKAHSKTCGTREYKCDCGTLFSRKDSFVTHRAFCDALGHEDSGRFSTTPNMGFRIHQQSSHFSGVFNNAANLDHLQKPRQHQLPLWLDANPHEINSMEDHHPADWVMNRGNESFCGGDMNMNMNVQSLSALQRGVLEEDEEENKGVLSDYYSSSLNLNPQETNSSMSPTDQLLQQAAQMDSTRSNYSSVFGTWSSSFPTLDHQHHHQHHHHHHHHNNVLDQKVYNKNNNDGRRWNEFMACTSASTLTSNNNTFMDDTNSSSVLMGISNNTNTKHDVTRDFLGVGMNQNRDLLAELAAMRSAMEMGSYSRKL